MEKIFKCLKKIVIFDYLIFQLILNWLGPLEHLLMAITDAKQHLFILHGKNYLELWRNFDMYTGVGEWLGCH